MGNITSDNNSDTSVRNTILMVCIVGVVVAVFLSIIFSTANTSNLQGGLVATSTIGGVVGSLSILGISLTTLSSVYVKRYVKQFGVWTKAVLFKGYCVIVLLSILCAIFSVFPENMFAPWIMGVSVSAILVAIFLTLLTINGIFESHLHSEQPEMKNPFI